MKQPFAKAIGHHVIQAEARRFENRFVRIEDLAGRTHRDNELRNRVDDLSKLLLIPSQGGFVPLVCDRNARQVSDLGNDALMVRCGRAGLSREDGERASDAAVRRTDGRGPAAAEPESSRYVS